MTIQFEKFNEAVKEWGAAGRSMLQSTGRGMGITHRPGSPSKGESLSKLKNRYGFDKSGAINKVTFGNINRSLIYAAAGAGRGRGGLKGSRWLDKAGNRKTTDPNSLGKMGTGGRTEKPFINTALDSADGVEALADIVAEHTGDAIIGSVYVK